MKIKKNIFLIKLLFLLVMVSLFTSYQGLVGVEKADLTILARVEVTGMLNDLKLPVYAHLQDAAGQDYALVIAPQAQLDQAGAPYRILDKDAGEADYFILHMVSAEKPGQGGAANLPDNVLLNDGKHIVIRSTFPQVERLVEVGFEAQWLGHTPMVVASPGREPETSAQAIDYDAVIAGLLDQVTQTKVQTYTNYLSGVTPVVIGGSSYTIATRYTNSGTPISKATQYVYEFMQGLGLTVSYHNWSLSGYTGRNVIGQITGTTQPNEIVLITAHLDDMPSGATAPGADDNASGSVGVMLGAELLKQQQFKRTVRFVFFTGEEQGLLGSVAYSNLVYGNGDNIVAVYNMDMISYDAAGLPYLRLHTRTTSNPGYPGDLAIANTFVDVVNAYSLSSGLSPIITADGESRSDHNSFWSNGYSAILGIEDHINDMTPYYHLTSDTVSTLNWIYYTNYAKASVGMASHLALRDDGTIIANFSGSPTIGAVPLTVNFTDLSIGATSWSWNFGDSGTSTLKNPSHTYTSTGLYTVTLTASNASGSDVMTKTDYITVTPPAAPVAGFTASATNITVGNSVAFTDQSTNNPTSWSWTFEGGTPATSTAQNPTVTYNTPGVFDVTLIASNAQGNDTEAKVDYINVSEVPYCASQGSNYSMEWIARVQVGTLDNSSGAAGYTDFTSITCNLTGGTSANVTLTPGFSSSTYSEYWKIWIDYNGDHDFLDTGEEEFSGTGTSAVTGSFTVNPGIDVLTRMRVSMKYAAIPTSCETFSYGEVEDYTANVVSGGANLPPTADFTFTTNGLTATFTDASTDSDGTVVAWSWNFGDGGVSTLQNPVHTYATAGTYNVTLTVTDDDGAADPVVKPVTVSTTQMYVYDIAQTITKAGKKYKSTAVVTIRDTNNAWVPNAAVYITWSGVVSGSTSGVTNSSGNVTFTSAQVSQTGPFTITVTNVTHATIPYNPALNIKTSDTKSY
jgi:PKD repeat protein